MAEVSYPQELLYHPEHDWARVEDDVATFGITWHAQDALGEVVFFDPPTLGAALVQNEPYAEVESVKAVSDVIAPLSHLSKQCGMKSMSGADEGLKSAGSGAATG